VEPGYPQPASHDLSFQWHVVEQQLSGPAFDVQLHRTHFPAPGEGVFQSSWCFIEMFFTATRQVKASFLSSVPAHDRSYLGDVAFVPARTALYYDWMPGVQRCIACGFDIRALATLAAPEWTWPSFDPEQGLHIRNEYVALGLRRIAEELLSPGFSSALQVECTLMFIALELRRHLGRNADGICPRNGRLSSRQLATLHSMVLDSAAAPTIAEMAAVMGMGARQLAHSYRGATGGTLRSFIATGRLERAKNLLHDGRMKIQQVARDAGFRSAPAFAAAFRKATGLTPREFRRHGITLKRH
jgi:AraC family transcriptional regulator